MVRAWHGYEKSQSKEFEKNEGWNKKAGMVFTKEYKVKKHFYERTKKIMRKKYFTVV